MKNLTKNIGIVALAAIFILFTGCEALKNTNKAQRGGAIGAGAGAIAGGVIGNNVGDGHNTAVGALIGAVVGGAAGAMIGNKMDKQARQIDEEIPGAEVTRVGEGISVTFDENSGIYFATDKYDLKEESKESLKKLAKIFQEYPDTNILLEGHTDNTGRAEYNMGLSEKRAKSVRDYLMSQGVGSQRFTTKWYGEEQPKYDNETAEGRSKNRRVEIAIMADDQMKAEAQKATGGE